jgi:hypothetical protein
VKNSITEHCQNLKVQLDENVSDENTLKIKIFFFEILVEKNDR